MPWKEASMAITLEHVSYVYEKGTAMESRALDDISLTLEDDRFIALIGHTGSGKSTLVQLLNGLLAPTEGRVLFDGEDIHGEGYDMRGLRARVGLVFQYPEQQLFEETVLRDVMFGPLNLGLSEDVASARAEEALRRVGLDPDVHRRSPFDLSGGRKRRAAIAGVIAMQPRYLVLDEPTAGLDPQGRDQLLSLLEQMRREMKITIILVSHSMEEVARAANRIIVMNSGRILLDGAPDEIFRHTQELEGVGLAAPQITYTMQYLRAQGMDVRTDMLTVGEASQEILRAVGKA